MKFGRRYTVAALAVAATLTTGVAQATDGYFSHGYGMKAKGRGGASTAMTTDTFGGANNPATMVWVDNRLDVGVDLFRPDRATSRTGSNNFGFGTFDGAADGNDTTNFLIPEFGYNKLIHPDLSLGVTVYGNGGMNTDYDKATFNYVNPALPSETGVDLTQLFIVPTYAIKITPKHAFGISPILAYQAFEAKGLEIFGASGFSDNADKLTGNGTVFSAEVPGYQTAC